MSLIALVYADSSVHVERGAMLPFSWTEPNSIDVGFFVFCRWKRTTSITIRLVKSIGSSFGNIVEVTEDWTSFSRQSIFDGER